MNLSLMELRIALLKLQILSLIERTFVLSGLIGCLPDPSLLPISHSSFLKATTKELFHGRCRIAVIWMFSFIQIQDVLLKIIFNILCGVAINGFLTSLSFHHNDENIYKYFSSDQKVVIK